MATTSGGFSFIGASRSCQGSWCATQPNFFFSVFFFFFFFLAGSRWMATWYPRRCVSARMRKDREVDVLRPDGRAGSPSGDPLHGDPETLPPTRRQQLAARFLTWPWLNRIEADRVDQFLDPRQPQTAHRAADGVGLLNSRVDAGRASRIFVCAGKLVATQTT